MEELVDAADGIVAELAPRQTRYKVTERPDARTIRYYVTQGLLPKPLGYDGGRARYGGRICCGSSSSSSSRPSTTR